MKPALTRYYVLCICQQRYLVGEIHEFPLLPYTICLIYTERYSAEQLLHLNFALWLDVRRVHLRELERA